jgi:3-hydroxybutyryl-CoA dehydratase
VTATSSSNTAKSAPGRGTDRRFEDFPVGTVCVTGGRTVDLCDISLFAGLTGDHYPLHTDEQYASQTQFGGRIAHGPLTFSIAVGLVALSGFLGEAIVALREVASIRALKPVRPGDTLHVRAEVIAAEPARRNDQGTLSFDYQVINQREETVMTVRMVMLARRRERDRS